MILLFTSSHCTWCEVVRGMIEEQLLELNLRVALYSINIEENVSIAETYGVLEVPTIVSGSKRLSGLPSFADLRSLLFQSVIGRFEDIPISKLLVPPHQSNHSSDQKESAVGPFQI